MRRAFFALALACAACGSTEERPESEPVAPILEPVPEAPEPEVPAEPPAPGFEDWGTEHITLPPAFAPGLPPGEEELLFAPGMFDPEAEDYWAYVFVVQFEDSRMRSDYIVDFFEQYYDGLMSSVAGSRGLEIPEDPAKVILLGDGDGEYVANVETIDAFVTGEPLNLRLEIRCEKTEPSGLRMEVLASPQAETHAIWQELSDAIATIEL